MGLIYHAALENSLIKWFMDSRLWNAPLRVFCRLVDMSKRKSTIFLNRLVATNRRIAKALVYIYVYLYMYIKIVILLFKTNKEIVQESGYYVQTLRNYICAVCACQKKKIFRFEACDAHIKPIMLFSVHVNTTFRFINTN